MSFLSTDPIALVEQGYAPQPDTESWIRALAGPINQLATPSGVGWCAFGVGPAGVGRLYSHSLPMSDAEVVAEIKQAIAGGHEAACIAPPIADALHMQGIYSTVGTTGRLEQTPGVERRGLADTCNVVLHCAGETVIFTSLVMNVAELESSQLALWRRLAAHLSAGSRLGGRAASTDAPDVEAILAADGRVLHAGGVGSGARARERLCEATRAMDRSRTRRGRADPMAALSLWRGLVAGRWSLVDHFDSDGKRFILARENPPDLPGAAGLTQRQRQILFYVGAGWSNKEVGYALGVAESTVAVHLRNALRTLGLRSRAEWIALDNRLTSLAGDRGEGAVEKAAAAP